MTVCDHTQLTTDVCVTACNIVSTRCYMMKCPYTCTLLDVLYLKCLTHTHTVHEQPWYTSAMNHIRTHVLHSICNSRMTGPDRTGGHSPSFLGFVRRMLWLLRTCSNFCPMMVMLRRRSSTCTDTKQEVIHLYRQTDRQTDTHTHTHTHTTGCMNIQR